MWKNGYAILPLYSIMNSISCPDDRQRQRYKVFLREGAQMNRLYDDTSLERLQQILLFKELEFPLKEIKKIIDAPNFDRNKALEQQIELLTMKKEHLENLISFARGIKGIGVKYMDFKVFDTTKIDEYSKRAKEQWGQTSEYKEFEEKTKNWTKDDETTVANEFMQLFVEFGQMKEMDPEDEQVQLQVRKLQDYITEDRKSVV